MCDEVSDDLIHLITMDGKVLDEAFMVVWTIMGSFRLSEFVKKRIISMNGVMIPELCHTAYVDNVLHTIARCFRYANWRFTYDVHSEMRTLNAMTRQEREKLLSDLGLECLRAYDEDWYSCYCSLEILRKKTSSTTTVTISKFSQLLCKLWGAIYRAIRTISASRCSTSNLCLIELLKLREVLQYEQATNSDDDDITERLLREAKDRLDEAIRDSYLVWSIPLVLDPRYKLKYIKFSLERAFGSEAAANMISEVARTINHVYTCVNMEDDDEDDGEISVDNADPLEQAWDEECLLQDSIREVDNCPEAKTTELDRYLQDPLVPRVKGFDILKWWKKNSQKYPKVAQIARPALAMPTCSKLSSGQIAYVRSIVRGYSKYPYIPLNQYE
uniref:HAT C-terminal dimerisation domain-containing protein n=1 Tax=Arundo donax TaxID=35708 RepID=A0A0A9C283_ARUDO